MSWIPTCTYFTDLNVLIKKTSGSGIKNGNCF